MGSQHNLDSFTKIHLPPTFSSPAPSQTAPDARIVPMKITTATPPHTPIYTGAVNDHVKPDAIKQEVQPEKEVKTSKPRKKRGQYKKTILRQQAQAAAAAAAAAAGLPPPQFPGTKTKSATQQQQPQQQEQQQQQTPSGVSISAPKGKNRIEEPSGNSASETLDIRSHRLDNDRASPTTLEMERELAMLAEEAEEDKRRREEEAADRILKRAQVVKHLRSLKSKLATAQIQIGHDLQYQSIDLFSQLYDEVLEDIGRDNNSEMLNLLKNSLKDQALGGSDLDASELTDHHMGHMPTRSSDKPRKGDLVPNTSRALGGAAKGHTTDHVYHRPHVVDLDVDSDDSITLKRSRRTRGNSQFIGQSWDIAGRDGSVASHRFQSSPSKAIIHLEDDDDVVESNLRKLERSMSTAVKPITQTREELQLKQRRELEDLQLQQRKDQEEFQRKQLDQLRELQERQNTELQEYDETKARQYREHLESLAEKRLKLNQSRYSRRTENGAVRSRHKETYSSTSMAYEFDNGFHNQDAEHTPADSMSPSPVSSQQYSTRNDRNVQASQSHNSSNLDSDLLGRSLSSHNPIQTLRAQKINGGINTLPMSTMTIALTAMNEKKRQLKRAMRRQQEHDDSLDGDEESSDQDEQSAAGRGRRFLSPPNRSQKRSAPEDALDVKRSPSIAHSTLSSLSTPSSQHGQHSNAGHPLGRSGSYSRHLHKPLEASHILSPHSQPCQDPSEEPLSPSPNYKAKKRKNPISPPSKTLQKFGAGSAGGVKPAMSFNKTLLSHFEKWNSDEKAENFFDFVLSDPPDIDVDDAEVQGLLSVGKQSNGHGGDHRDLNATPTSNAFRWFQEQQQLAQELARQPKMAPLRLMDEGSGQYHSSTEAAVVVSRGANGGLYSEGQGHDGHDMESGLIPGEDPLAAFIQPRRKSHDGHKSSSNAAIDIGSHDHNSQSQDASRLDNRNKQSSNHVSNNHGSHQRIDDQGAFAVDSSPFLSSSPASHMLYSEDGPDNWTFQSFSMDSTEEYLHHDSPLQSNRDFEHLDF
ncbi:hypothetical protein EDD11_001647 [Mortierella claussenii]|nr:hypothetical protein EDD11_001647 [Mortierella claussenii]